MTELTRPYQTIVEILQIRAAKTPDQIAYEFLVDGDRQSEFLTYGALLQQAQTIAAVLRKSCGVGDRVLILHPPGLSYIAAFYGCLYGGLIAVPAYPPRKNRSVERILALIRDSTPKIALTTQSILSLLKPRIIEFPELRTVQWLLSDCLDFSGSLSFSPPSLDSSSLAFLQYTSGSTAAPKGVMISHGNLLHNIRWMCRYVQPEASSFGVFWLPPYHDMGLIAGILAPLYMRFPSTLMSPYHFLQRPLRWLEAISGRQASFSGGPSFAYRLCVTKIKPDELKRLDLSSWRVAFNGAEPIQSRTIEQFAQKFMSCGFRNDAFFPCYGMAEATLMVTWSYDLPRPNVEKMLEISAKPLVSAGKSLGDQTVIIVDPETQKPCEDGKEGEIWVSGESVAQGYWNQTALTQRTFRASINGNKSFLRTGDLGVLMAQELFVTGRLKDLLIVNGVNYHPHDLEGLIEQSHQAIQMFGVAVVAVTQLPESALLENSEHLLACVELNRQYVRKRELFETIVQAVKRSVAREFQLVLHHIVLLKPGKIPKTSSGKLQRYLCRQTFVDGSLEQLYQYDLQNAANQDHAANQNNEIDGEGVP